MSARILLMTSTINPRKGEPLLKRMDPKERMADYKKALAHYLGFINKGIDKIVFVDNSEADLSELIELCQPNAKHVELISYYGLDYPIAHGRGYGEFKLLDYAMKNARTIQAAADDDQILKITGRYLMVNMDDILKRLPATDILLNFRNYPIKWADMFFAVWTKSFYNAYLKEVYLKFKMDETEVAPEVTFRTYLESLPAGIKIKKRYNTIPIIDAPKGMNNQSYRSFANQAKYYSRAFMNRVFPWLWI